MAKPVKHFYEFGPFRIDVANRLLLREGKPVPLTIKAFDTLLVLVESNGQVLGKDELMKAVWPDAAVEENNLNQQVSTLRKLMGEGPDGQKYIETVPRRGYRFVADVKEVRDEYPGHASQPSTLTTSPPQEPAQEKGADSFTTAPAAAREVSAASSRPGPRPSTRRAIILLAALAAVVIAIYVLLSRPSKIKSIAVLPFQPLVAANSDVYLELGMADALITRLSSIKQLTVRPTSAVLRYVEGEQDAVKIGQLLGVDAVLEGRVQKSQDMVRVTVQLIRVNDGTVLWADAFDASPTSILHVQDAISEKMAGTLALELTGEERKSLTKHYTENAEAYELYLKGRYYWYKWNEEAWKKAAEYFQKAIEKDDKFALAYAGLADAYGVMGFVAPPIEAYLKSKEAVLKALELDKTLAEAHVSLGALKMFNEWDRPAARDEIVKAIEMNPNNALAHDLYGILLSTGGDIEGSIRESKRAQELDPLSPYMNTDLGAEYYYARRYDEAIWHFNKALEIDPNHIDGLNFLAAAHEQKGMYAEAVEEWAKALALAGDQQTATAISQAYAASGYQAALRRWLDRLHELARERYVPAISFADIHARLGEKEQAMQWLEKAYEEKSNWVVWLKVDPRWDSFHADASFRDYLRRIRLDP